MSFPGSAEGEDTWGESGPWLTAGTLKAVKDLGRVRGRHSLSENQVSLPEVLSLGLGKLIAFGSNASSAPLLPLHPSSLCSLPPGCCTPSIPSLLPFCRPPPLHSRAPAFPPSPVSCPACVSPPCPASFHPRLHSQPSLHSSFLRPGAPRFLHPCLCSPSIEPLSFLPPSPSSAPAPPHSAPRCPARPRGGLRARQPLPTARPRGAVPRQPPPAPCSSPARRRGPAAAGAGPEQPRAEPRRPAQVPEPPGGRCGEGVGHRTPRPAKGRGGSGREGTAGPRRSEAASPHLRRHRSLRVGALAGVPRGMPAPAPALPPAPAPGESRSPAAAEPRGREALGAPSSLSPRERGANWSRSLPASPWMPAAAAVAVRAVLGQHLLKDFPASPLRGCWLRRFQLSESCELSYSSF